MRAFELAQILGQPCDLQVPVGRRKTRVCGDCAEQNAAYTAALKEEKRKLQEEKRAKEAREVAQPFKRWSAAHLAELADAAARVGALAEAAKRRKTSSK
jgi:hypothetical protein